MFNSKSSLTCDISDALSVKSHGRFLCPVTVFIIFFTNRGAVRDTDSLVVLYWDESAWSLTLNVFFFYIIYLFLSLGLAVVHSQVHRGYDSALLAIRHVPGVWWSRDLRLQTKTFHLRFFKETKPTQHDALMKHVGFRTSCIHILKTSSLVSLWFV